MRSIRHVVLASSVLLTLLTCVLGAQARECPALRAPISATDRSWCDVDSVPRLADTSVITVAPRYPDLLRSANVEGTVVAELSVDEGGAVDMGSVRFVQSSHDLFTNAVKSAIRRWRFVPAVVGGRYVRARGTVRVDFLLPGGDSIPVVAIADPIRQTPNGIEIRLGWRVPPRAAEPVIDTTRTYALIERIVREFGTTDTLRARCIDWSPTEKGEDAPPPLIAYLKQRGVPRLPMSRCPPTYASMIVTLDPQGKVIQRPNGTYDPHIVTISGLVAWNAGQFVFNVSEGSGNGRHISRCQADWNAETRA